MEGRRLRLPRRAFRRGEMRSTRFKPGQRSFSSILANIQTLKRKSLQMEFRQLGGSGFKVPVLSLGTGTFGGKTELFQGFGSSDVKHATRLVDLCLESGLNMFDSADVYSNGQAEEFWAKRSTEDGTGSSFRPREPSAWARDPMMSVRRGIT
jgi:Aldo/keto reductase family